MTLAEALDSDEEIGLAFVIMLLLGLLGVKSRRVDWSFVLLVAGTIAMILQLLMNLLIIPLCTTLELSY